MVCGSGRGPRRPGTFGTADGTSPSRLERRGSRHTGTSSRIRIHVLAGRGITTLPVLDDTGRLLERRIRSIPVLEQGHVIGIVTWQDLLSAQIGLPAQRNQP